MKRAKAAGVLKEEFNERQRKTQKRLDNDKAKRDEKYRIAKEAEEAEAAGLPLTELQQKHLTSVRSWRLTLPRSAQRRRGLCQTSPPLLSLPSSTCVSFSTQLLRERHAQWQVVTSP